jgi:hypothetical protein
MGLLDLLFGGGAQQAPQQDPNAQAQMPSASASGPGISPLAQSLLAGYFSAIGSPKLSGWGGALSRGGLSALGTYQDASYQNQQAALHDAYIKRAMAQADKAERGNTPMWYNKDTGAWEVIPAGQAPQGKGYIPQSAYPAYEAAQNKSTTAAKPVIKDVWDPEAGRNVPRAMKIDSDSGQLLVGGGGTNDSYVPFDKSGFQGKGDKQREETVQAVAQARSMGDKLLTAMDEADAAGAPNRAMDILGTLAYKAGSGFQNKEDAVRALTSGTKQQLMGMAQKSSGSRAFQFVKLIQDHFPDVWDERHFKRGKIAVMFGKGGLVDTLDHFARYGAPNDAEADRIAADLDARLTAAENEGSGQAGGALPPKPPIAPVPGTLTNSQGTYSFQGVDGKTYTYSPGSGWVTQ